MKILALISEPMIQIPSSNVTLFINSVLNFVKTCYDECYDTF